MPINFLHPVDKELGKGSGGEINNAVFFFFCLSCGPRASVAQQEASSFG